jgi:2-polyprenyl-3-methyl-5-hydroxy-6-metoxy-1,4-benzoquinol methylase
MNEETHERESVFHDQWAASVDLKAIPVREVFESVTAMENRFMLRLMGDLRGKRLLDIGCGLGESSVYFALKGAEVTAVDLSPGMVQTASELAKTHGVRVEGVVAAAEDLPVTSSHYDVAYAANTLHHTPDRRKFLQHIQRALKPGGRVFLWDPLAYDPIIDIYRRMATRVRTPDEAPLTFKDVALVKEYFAEVRHREFWILSLALFLKYYFIDRIHPNQQRYWKLIYRESAARLWWWRPLASVDSLLARIPLVRRLAWNTVIWGRRL